MFLYWDGFEIDGSDTDFDIVLPETVQVVEFVEFFLSIPIFSSDMKPYISYYEKKKERVLDIESLNKKLLSGDYPDINIAVNCLHIEQLSDELRAKIYAISARREPHEANFGKVKNPCTHPVIQQYYSRGEMTVELCIDKSDTKPWYTADKIEASGYSYNIELIRSASQNNGFFQVSVGPTSYYEYAMFIMDYLRDGFPGMAINGGLDCAGGWTEGCTYCDSLYRYEKIQVPVAYSIKNTLKRLTEYDIVRSYKYFYKKGWNYEYTNGFYLANHPPLKPRETLKPISFSEYIELIEVALSCQSDTFSKVCNTAVDIMLPQPDLYSKNPDAVKILRAALPENANEERYFTGYLAFTLVDGKPVTEFRIHHTLKKYLLTLLKLADSGKIDFIKALTYGRRND